MGTSCLVCGLRTGPAIPTQPGRGVGGAYGGSRRGIGLGVPVGMGGGEESRAYVVRGRGKGMDYAPAPGQSEG